MPALKTIFAHPEPDYVIRWEKATYAEWASRGKLGRYEVAEANLGNLKDKIASLNRKAIKLGTKPIILREVGKFSRMEWIGELGKRIRLHYVLVYLYGETPKLNGWQFVATLQHMEAGNIVRSIPGAPALPESYRTAASHCDHCQSTRRRNDTYVVWNEGTGEFKQVGSNCLADFTGALNPHRAAQAAQFLALADEAGHDAEDSSYARSQSYYDTLGFLTRVAVTIRTEGWVSRTAAQENGRYPTADRALDDMKKAPKDVTERAMMFAAGERNIPEIPTDEDITLATAALAWVRSGLGKAASALSEYEHNLMLACQQDAVSYRETGLVASAVNAYKRFSETEIERLAKPESKPSEYVGTEGQRLMLENITCTFTLEIEGHYGVTVLHKFIDEAGNVITWFASNAHLDQGSRYSGKATIKAHEDYKGTKQTTITRFKPECVFDAVWAEEHPNG